MLKGTAEDGLERLPGGGDIWAVQAMTGVTQEKADVQRTTSGI